MPSTTPPPRWTSWSSENRGLTADLTAGRRLVSRPRLPGWAAPWLLLTPALILLCVLVLLPYAGALLFSVTDVLLVVSSALTNVPQSLILAGQVDGAGTLTIIRRIVLPNIRRAFLLAALVAVVSGLNVFDLIFVMTGGGPTYQTETLALTMYRLTFRRGDIGEGAAVTVMLFCFSLALAIVYVWSWQREARKWR